MAYIGKVKVPNTWTSLQSLIQDQIDGQSSFAFESGKTYSIQVDGPGRIDLCDSETLPTDNSVGEHLNGKQFGVYSPDAGVLYVRLNLPWNIAQIAVSELA